MMKKEHVYPIVRYRFESEITAPLMLPFYSGSMLRGAFGHALRKIACMTKIKDCNACPLKETCPYTLVFEPSAHTQQSVQNYTQLPAPYVIEPPKVGEKLLENGERLSFNMVIMSKALDQLPLIILAWKRALQFGLGKHRGKANLLQVTKLTTIDETAVWNAEEGQLLPHNKHTSIQIPSTLEKVTLQISTPMRLQRNSKPVGPETINSCDLMGALHRRWQMFTKCSSLTAQNINIREVTEQAKNLNSDTQLHWTDWARYSNRQKQRIALGGVTGQWVLQGDLSDHINPIILGQWLHIGKNTTFGMGEYQLLLE